MANDIKLNKRWGKATGALLALAVIGGGVAWYKSEQAKGQRVYVPSGYGGFMTVKGPLPAPKQKPDTPIWNVIEAYRKGRWSEVESEADIVVEKQAGSSIQQERDEALLAMKLRAYAAAWKHDYPLAQRRFSELRDVAETFPEHGKQPSVPGETAPSVMEEAAFQYVVCTSAMGDKQGAEEQYKAFVMRYPQSILIHAAVKRIARLHGGDIPKDAEALWKQAMALQKREEQAKERANSMCAPECLAELLRRQSKPGDVASLARLMKTDHEGTSLENLAEAATKEGFHPRGVELTQKGLLTQKLPLIALLGPGHFVLVDRVTPTDVTIWDPDAGGVGKSAVRTLLLKDWQAQWHGIALALEP